MVQKSMKKNVRLLWPKELAKVLADEENPLARRKVCAERDSLHRRQWGTDVQGHVHSRHYSIGRPDFLRP